MAKVDITFFKKDLTPYADEYSNTRVGIEHYVHPELPNEEDSPVTEEQAITTFNNDCSEIKTVLDETKQIFTSNQLTALTSFIISIGIDTFRGSYCFFKLKQGQLKVAAAQFKIYNKLENGEISEFLTARRSNEYSRFIKL